MTKIPKNDIVDLAYQFFKRIQDDDFEYIYRGFFSQKMSKKILSLAETNVKKVVDKTALRNRIYFIMIEGLQNVTKHQEQPEENSEEPSPLDVNEETGMFAIQRNKEKYFVTTGNLVKKNDEIELRSKLDQINLLEKAQLKKLHKEMLYNGTLTDKGGAGLGLIEMARKSGNRLLYDFKNVDDASSFFYFRTEIPQQTKNTTQVPSINNERSIDDVKVLHQRMEDENVLINFNGQFHRDNILSLLSIIRGQMNVNAASKKVYNIMVEMLQNISKHTNDIPGSKKNRGIFILSFKNDAFILTSGNLVFRKFIDPLTESLEATNAMSDAELHEHYNSILMDFENVTETKTGLGLVDIRIKSNNKIRYSFKVLDDEMAFFTLQTAVLTK